MSIKIENVEVFGWEAAIRGARNLMNSWKESDSRFFDFGSSEGAAEYKHFHTLGKEQVKLPMAEGERLGSVRDLIGQEDYMLLMNMSKGGSEESKWRRMIHVQLDITAPLYWWKEFDTYKVGTVANSTSTMHKITSAPFSLSQFSCDKMDDQTIRHMQAVVDYLEELRLKYLDTKDKQIWYDIIQFLPSSYNQMRTCTMNYENLIGIYASRRNHKLDEWHVFCRFVEELPYAQELITL